MYPAPCGWLPIEPVGDVGEFDDEEAAHGFIVASGRGLDSLLGRAKV
jgi:hypothetical protein